MRPVDLTPPEERRGQGDRAAARAGNLSYVVIAALVLGLLGVAAMALTSKSITDKEAQVASLETDLEAAEAKANALRPFAEFRSIQESRASTVASLAQSRFDWKRVMEELALVLPEDVWLTSLTGTVLPEVSVPDEVSIGARDSILGPALEIVGCAPSQDAVAGFVAALEDIDGVTRVGVASSSLPERDDAAVPGTSSQEDDCRTRDFISKFEIVAAFDAVPAPAGATAPPSGVPGSLPSGDEGQLADAQAQEAAAAGSATEQTANAQNASQTLLPGG
jgi:Tfp pilus assembly protein PilN